MEYTNTSICINKQLQIPVVHFTCDADISDILDYFEELTTYEDYHNVVVDCSWSDSHYIINQV